MRSSLVAILSLSVIASSSRLPQAFVEKYSKEEKRDYLSLAVDCNGEIYNNICCVNGEWSGPAIVSAITSDAAAIASTVDAFFIANSASIVGVLSTAIAGGGSWVISNSASLEGDLSTLSSFAAANSAALQYDLSGAQTFISGLESTLSSIEATITPPSNPFVKRETITVDKTSIETAASSALSDLNSIATALIPIVATINPPPRPLVTVAASIVTPASSVIQDGINGGINAMNSAEPFLSGLAGSVAAAAATYVPPEIIFDKRSVTVVSQGLTCHGQAAVTLTATNAASLISSATSAAKGTHYYADGSSGTLAPTATAKSTSTLAAGAAMVTRGPMLAGAAVALVFAAL